MDNVKVIRNIMTGYHRSNTRIWIEPTALEAAGIKIGDSITQTVTRDAVILRRSREDTGHSVSRRKRPSWSEPRPLYETCNKEVTMVLLPRERIDILVSDGMLVIRKERSFDLFYIETPRLQGGELKKLRLLSGPCGGGIGTAAAVDTGLFEAVGGMDIWPEAIDAYLNNFGHGTTFLGDLTRIHPDYIPEADVCLLSPSCLNFTSLGVMGMGVSEGHGPHYGRIAHATGACAVVIEQVPAYFKSSSYAHLKKLLQPFYPVINETVIDAYDIGSVAGRTRGYAVFFREETSFSWPVLPALPLHRRKTVGQVIGKNWAEGEWRSIEGTVMHGLLNKTGNNNFKADKNHTLVGLDHKRISAIVANYRRYQVTSSYLRHPEEADRWRPFRSDELASFLNVPEFYSFPEWMSEGVKTKLLGQSVDCDVVRAIMIETAVALMGCRYRSIAGRQSEIDTTNVYVEEGQAAFHFTLDE